MRIVRPPSFLLLAVLPSCYTGGGTESDPFHPVPGSTAGQSSAETTGSGELGEESQTAGESGSSASSGLQTGTPGASSTTMPGADGDGGDQASDVDQTDRFGSDDVEVMVYRVDFADTPFGYAEDALVQDLDTAVAYYEKQSYGRFGLSYTLHPEILHAPGDVADYDDWYSFVDFYEAAIEGAGVDPLNPGPDTRIMVAAPQIGNYNSSGAPPLTTVFHQDATVIAHEFGHTFGLHHARAVEAGDSTFGRGDPDAESLDYGNVYCLMGSGAHAFGALNLVYKSFFGWLEPSEVPRATESGTYRIFALEEAPAPGRPVGITLHSGDEKLIYWVEYRVGAPFATGNGVVVNLEGYFPADAPAEYFETTSHLLDMTPGSLTDEFWWADDLTDAELGVGATFSDPWGAFHLTPIATGGGPDAASRWIDVEVDFG